MKKLLPLLVFTLFIGANLFAVNSTPNKKTTKKELSQEEKSFIESLEVTSMEEFLSLTPAVVQAKTGKKLKFGERLRLKVAQKKIAKLEKKGNFASGDKSQIAALLLVIFVGVLGIHRFYLGYIGIGIIQLLTLGGFGIWALIDMIMIITGNLKPKNGRYDKTF